MRVIIFLIAAFIASVVNAQESKGVPITVVVQNVKASEGPVRLALYTQNNFRKKPVAAASGEIVNGRSTVTFENVPAGTYAILGFHDENNNEKLDFHTYGMPKEDYGASNNQMSFGPPQWEDTKFVVKQEPINMEIKF